MFARRLTLSAVAALAISAAALTATAAPAAAAGPEDPACIIYAPELPPYCPVKETWEDIDGKTPDPPPAAPHCALDDPRYPRCTGYVRQEFLFQAANPNSQRHPTTQCKVALEGAVPASANGYDRVQFRVSNDCDAPMRRVDLDVRLKDAYGNVKSTAPHAYCHQFEHFGCGDLWMASTGDRSGLSWGEYTIEATVRLALDEGQPGDPWVVTYGAPPADEPAGCAAGDYVTRCVLSIPIEVTPV